jgi:large subunit ribosomal protein L9
MKIILSKNVPNLGQTGEIKEVKEGYARNFLFPQGLAKLVTEATIKEMENKKTHSQKKVQNKAKKYKDVAKKVNNLKLIIKTKADEKKTLFAAIKAETISKELKNRHFDIPAQFIKLDEPIKHLGYYDVKIVFSDEVAAKIGLTVERED